MKIARHEEPSSSTITKKALRGIGLLAVVLLIGTMGYMFIESWPLLDAIYMTVITITTVGYGEIRNVDGAGRIFTIILIFMGMGSVAYTAGVMAQAMVEGQLQVALGRRRLGQKIKGLKDHYIICGYGRIGRVIIHELKSHGIPLVVVDSNPNLKGGMEHEVIPFIIDDATSEDVLLEAGVERAKGLVAVVLSDADNLFITMTARLLNQNLFILSRADEEATQRKLLRAGANRVVMPYLIGGQKMAQTIIRPAVTDFLEVTVHDKGIELKMEELVVGEKSRLNGVMLMDSKIRQEMNVIIVAIRKRSGQMIFNPSSQAKIEAGDILIALGHTTELEQLVEILAGD
jgi:voltage-gated potassium channel